ncbi:hypothetical protein HYW76_02895 [Candidatus Pacearchaeota archaeon]|nr:hypothetical protein [Candidatus Pacearchaeota archaeon]
MEMKRRKVIKTVEISGVKVNIELDRKEARKFPKRIESSIRIVDKEVEPIAMRSIFF